MISSSSSHALDMVDNELRPQKMDRKLRQFLMNNHDDDVAYDREEELG